MGAARVTSCCRALIKCTMLCTVIVLTSGDSTCNDACIPKGIHKKEGKAGCCAIGKASLKCPGPAHYDCGGSPPPTLKGMLVVAHDAGESLGLLPVLLQLASAATPAAVLALGEPAHTIFAAAAAANDFLTVYAPKDFGVNVTIVDQTRRNQTLSEVDMKLCVDGLSSPPPAVVLVGMAYLMQLQFAAAFLDHGAVGATPNAVIGFDDGFDRFDPSSLQGLFVSGAPAIGSVGPAITDFFVTASTIAVAARAYASKQKIRLNVLTTGSPTIASWADAAANSTQIALTRAALFGADTRPAILYAGGYGTGANESLRLFAKAVLATNTSYQYAFSPHPGIPSSRALEIFEECGVLDLVLIVDKSICAGTGLAAVACNATVSEGSTVAVQSVFVGVPSFYIANSTADAANVLVDSGQIPVDTAVAAAISTLRSFEAEGWHFDRSRLDNAGIPTNATAIMCKRVADLLKQRGVSDPSV